MAKEIFRTVVAAVLVAALLTFASKFSGESLVHFMGGATTSDLDQSIKQARFDLEQSINRIDTGLGQAIKQGDIVVFRTRKGEYWSANPDSKTFTLVGTAADNPQSYEQVFILHEGSWK